MSRCGSLLSNHKPTEGVLFLGLGGLGGLGSFGCHRDDAGVSLGIAEHKAGSLGEDDTLGVSHTLVPEAYALGVEGEMGILCDVFGIKHHAIVLHAAQVEYLGVGDVESSEIGYYPGEFHTPYYLSVGVGDASVVFELIEGFDET